MAKGRVSLGGTRRREEWRTLLERLIKGVEADIEADYNTLNGGGPVEVHGRQRTLSAAQWRWAAGEFGWGARLVQALVAYNERRQYETFANILAEPMAQVGPEADVYQRIRALNEVFMIWRHRFWPLPEAVARRLQDDFMGADEARERVQKELHDLILSLVSKALTDAQSFWQAYWLLADLDGDNRERPDGYNPMVLEPGVAEVPDVPGWADRACQYIQAPSLLDLRVNPDITAGEFAEALGKALVSGTAAELKAMRAYLLERPDLYQQTPDLLRAAVWVFAANEQRPALPLVSVVNFQVQS